MKLQKVKEVQAEAPEGAAIPSREELVRRARALIPVLQERAPRQDKARRILDETIADLKEAGFFKILQPRRWGGYELDPSTFFDVQMCLAEGDSSVGWVLGIVGVHNFHLALFDDQAARDVWGENSDILIASPYAPQKAVPVDGGYLLTGKWKFSSGTDHCDWIFLGGNIDRGEGAGPPDMRTFLLPRKDYQIIDTWNVVGLKGTGSQDIAVNGAFVPEYRTHKMSDAFNGTNPGYAVNTGALYRYPFWQIFLRAVSTAAIGSLQGMVNAFVDYGARRVSSLGVRTVLDPDATLALAEACAAIDEMKETLFRNYDRMRIYADKGEIVPMEDRYLYKFQCSSVPKRCLELAQPLFKAAGGAAAFDDFPFGRFYSDLLVMPNHAANQYQVAGRNWGGVMMGLENADSAL